MSNSSSNKNRRQLLIRIGGGVLTLALLVYVLKKQDLLSAAKWHEIFAAVAHIPVWLLALVLLLMLISRTAVGGRWHVLFRAAGADILARQSLKLTFAGLFASNFLPTTVGGDVVRLAGALRFKCDSGACLASLLIDRLVGVFGMVLMVPWAIPVALSSGMLGVAHQHGQVLQSAPLTACLATGWKGKAGNFIRRIFAALAQGARHPRSLLLSWLFTSIHMCCFFTIIYLLLHGMGENTSYWMGATLWSIIYFFTLIPLTPNAYGIQEASYIFLFPHCAGVSPDHATALALLMRLFTMVASLPGALFLPSLLPDVRAVAQTPAPVNAPAGL